MQFPDFRSVNGRGCGPTQPFAFLPRMSQTSPGPFPQDLSFELGEDGQQSGHGSTSWCGRREITHLYRRLSTIGWRIGVRCVSLRGFHLRLSALDCLHRFGEVERRVDHQSFAF